VAEPASPIPYSETANDVVGGIFMTLWLISMVHAVWVRNEYLRRLDAVHGADPYAHLRREVAEETDFQGAPAPPWAPFDGGTPPPPPPPVLPPRPVAPVRAEPAGAPVDLNNAPEDELAALPGIGPLLARRAAEERRMRGGFGSLEEFGEVLALKPHIVERLRPRVVLGPPPPPSAPPAPGTGRRVVDF
jgi:DNA uptake protein ComE-like DNA-binding protein